MGSPCVIDVTGVKIVVIVASMRHDIQYLIRHRHHLVAEVVHLLRIGETVAPDDHLDAVDLDGLLTFRMGERTPDHGCLAVFFGKADIAVSEIAEFLDDHRVTVGVLVGADIES